jgi:hypothetical protein
MTNRLAQAAETLKTSWCKGRYRTSLPEGETFCSVGALADTFLTAQERKIDDRSAFAHAFSDATIKAEKSKELELLASVIRENYPEVPDYDFSDEVVIEFNDAIAKSSDEVIAMFEKAAVKWDETTT